MIPRSSSIRSRLLRRLLLPLTLLFLFDGWVAYRAALQAVNSAYDRSLLASVLAISEHTVFEGGGIIVDLPFVALALLETDFQDRVYYQVMGERGQYVTGYPDFPAPRSELPPEVPLYYDTTYRGKRCASPPGMPSSDPRSGRKRCLSRWRRRSGKGAPSSARSS